MSLGIGVSTAFYLTFLVYSILGIYGLYMNYKRKTNIVFFFICASMSIWSLGFAMSMQARQVGYSIFWNRLAALGWGTLYSLLLHFFLLITQEDSRLKTRWHYVLLYLPAFFTVYMFSIAPGSFSNNGSYELTKYGWLSITEINFASLFFKAYYIAYTLIGLFLVWKWGKASEAASDKKKAFIILLSFAFTLIGGTIVDQLLPLFYPIPQLGPIFVLVPTLAIYYTIKQYGLMVPESNENSNLIFNRSTRIKLYHYVAFIFILGALMNFFHKFVIHQQSILLAFSISLLVAGIGLAVLWIQHSPLKEDKKDTVSLSILAASIFLITLSAADTSTTTIWAFPFVLIIFSLAFNTRLNLYVIAVSMILTQLVAWRQMPRINIPITGHEYLQRILIIILVFLMAKFVNDIYRIRWQENLQQLKVQKLISCISTDLISVTHVNLNERINEMLPNLGAILDANRVIYFSQKDIKTPLHSTGKWFTPETVNRNSHDSIVLTDEMWLTQQLSSNKPVFIESTSELPEAAHVLKAVLNDYDIYNIIFIPISRSNGTLSLFCIENMGTAGLAALKNVDLLNIIFNLLSHTIKRVDMENNILYTANHDYLTNLLNRRALTSELDQAIEDAKQSDSKIGVIFIEIDSLRLVNDTLGHDGGDTLIKTLSNKLLENSKNTCTVGRYAGNEFICILKNTANDPEITSAAQLLSAVLREPLSINDQEFQPTVSIGISVYPSDGDTTASLVKNANAAMYKAKHLGRNQIYLCSEALKNEQRDINRIVKGLYKALEREEFYLHYQPQVDARTEEIIGVEALIRWQHPELGFISPAVFIPIAEKIGIINEIGKWVLKTACTQNKKWQEAGYQSLLMAVNVSTKQLKLVNFPNQVQDILQKTGMQSTLLELEITESVAMGDIEPVLNLLGSIKDRGVLISIDDFGTDYSSLSRLKMLPIDKIKIDKQFIDGIETSDKDRAIIRSIVDLSKNLKIKVIAEGVEYKNQLNYLQENKCDEIQGYYYYKPMPPEELEKLLKKN